MKNSLRQRCAAITALIGTALAVSVTPASAAGSARLGFFEGGCVPGTQGFEASGQFTSNGEFATSATVDFWGADTFSDDHLNGPIDALFSGIVTLDRFDLFVCVPFDDLDEDIGEDEVYAKVLIGFPGRTIGFRTNEISASF